jgi:hypothetical protein
MYYTIHGKKIYPFLINTKQSYARFCQTLTTHSELEGQKLHISPNPALQSERTTTIVHEWFWHTLNYLFSFEFLYLLLVPKY